jgi:hypothetical protein
VNVKQGSVLAHKSKRTHPGLIVVTLEDAPGEFKMTRFAILCSDMDSDPFWRAGKVMKWKLTTDDWKKIA